MCHEQTKRRCGLRCLWLAAHLFWWHENRFNQQFEIFPLEIFKEAFLFRRVAPNNFLSNFCAVNKPKGGEDSDIYGSLLICFWCYGYRVQIRFHISYSGPGQVRFSGIDLVFRARALCFREKKGKGGCRKMTPPDPLSREDGLPPGGRTTGPVWPEAGELELATRQWRRIGFNALFLPGV